MFAQFEKGDILNRTCNYAESGDKYDNEQIMMSKQDMDAINFGDKLDHDLITAEMLEDIRYGSQTLSSVNRRQERYKIIDCIRQRQLEWIGALKST